MASKLNYNLNAEQEVIRGITNVGNTCYMGSFLQLMFHNAAFRDDVLNTKVTDYSK